MPPTVLMPEIVKADAEMDVASWNAANPLHPRGHDGKFRDKIASALRDLGKGWGEVLNHAVVGEGDHEFSDHGVLALHDDGQLSISRIEDDGSTAAVANLGESDVLVLQERIEIALDSLDGLAPGSYGDVNDDDEDDPFPVSVEYGVLSDGTPYLTLSDNEVQDGETLQLTREHAQEFVEELGGLRSQQGQYERDMENPYLVRSLPEDETLLRRTKVTSKDGDDVILGIVDTSTGRALRLGLGGGDDNPVKSWTGGPGPMVADLGPQEIADLDEAIDSILDEARTVWGNQQVALDRLEEWDDTPDGERLTELYEQYEIYTGGDGLGGHRQFVREKTPGVPGHRGHKEGAEAPPEIYAEVERLQAEQSKIYTELGLINDEGAVVSDYDVETRAGTIHFDLYQWDLGTRPDIKLSIRPAGIDMDDWRDTMDSYEAHSQLTPQQLKALRKLITSALPDPIVKAARGGGHHGGKSWEEQWKHGKLARKWIGHPHPWTALYHHLRKHMPDEMAKRTAAQWHHDVFGIWPGEKRGKNPVGPG